MSGLGDREHADRLRALIRTQLSAGTLPSSASHHKVYAGYGEGQRCHACGQPIERSDVLYEIETQAPAGPLGTEAGTAMLAMHLQCFDIWVDESRQAGGDSPFTAPAGDTAGRQGRRPQ